MKTNFQKMNEAMEREGEPDDDFLNPVERHLILPRAEENRVRNVSCKKEKEALEECMQKYGFTFSPLCLFKNLFFAFCINKNMGSDDVKDDCLEEYLALRSKYRSTKDPKLLDRMRAMAFPSLFKPES